MMKLTTNALQTFRSLGSVSEMQCPSHEGFCTDSINALERDAASVRILFNGRRSESIIMLMFESLF